MKTVKTALTITTYDRPELFQKVLDNLMVKYPCESDFVCVTLDRDIFDDIGKKFREITNPYFERGLVELSSFQETNGIARATNASLDRGLYGSWGVRDDTDVVVHIDSDCYVEQSGWVPKMAQFLRDHPEVGLVAPDLPGRYMRIKRPGYDEVEYALGMVWAMRKDVLDKVKDFHGVGVFDENIHHQFDPDLCYRVRMLGKRIALMDVGNVVDLGVGTGDSSRTSSTWIGGFEFLRKWNLHHLGIFNYKSPMCLTWNMFPLNFLWRKLWLSQFQKNEELFQECFQGHTFDLVKIPWDQGKWQLKQSRLSLIENICFSGVDSFEKVSEDLLSGKRHWSVEDVQTKIFF